MTEFSFWGQLSLLNSQKIERFYTIFFIYRFKTGQVKFKQANQKEGSSQGSFHLEQLLDACEEGGDELWL